MFESNALSRLTRKSGEQPT